MNEELIYDVFISYNWDIKNEVRQFHENLSNRGFKVWRDEIYLTNDQATLAAQLAQAINKSKIFICCITEKYCKSYNCNLEIDYVNNMNKPKIVLMIDNLDPKKIIDLNVMKENTPSYPCGIGFIIEYIYNLF
jgi:hypothetical protein